MDEDAGLKRRNTRSVGVRDVARVAGVSTATVSRALNQPHRVSKELRSHVMAVAAELNYIPDAAARALSSQKSFRVGALIPTIGNSIFSRFLEALQRRLRGEGYSLLIANYDFDPTLEMEEARGMVEAGVDALILAGAQRPPEFYELLRRREIPYVLASIYLPDKSHPCVGYDNRAGATVATRHLLELGHREIGVIEGQSATNDRAALRRQGIEDALAAFGLTLDPARTTERAFSVRDGRNGLAFLLDKHPALTAVVCGNDVLAIGALMEAEARGLSVPRDLSITGYDGLDIAEDMVPSITTIHVPKARMGIAVAESLLGALKNETTPDSLLIETELKIGGTTAPPRSR